MNNNVIIFPKKLERYCCVKQQKHRHYCLQYIPHADNDDDDDDDDDKKFLNLQRTH